MLTKGTRATIKEWDDMVLLYGLTEDGDINTPGRVTFPKEDKDLCGEQIVIAYIRDVGEDILYECFLYDTMEILNFYVNNAMLTTEGGSD